MGETEHVDPEEFETWLLPRDLLDACYPTLMGDVAAPAAVNLLKEGLRRAAVRHASYVRGQEKTVGKFEVVPPEFWRANWARNPGSNFWQTGHVTQTYESTRVGSWGLTLNYIDLRFEPAILADLVPSRPAKKPSSDVAAGSSQSAPPPAALIDLDTLPPKRGRPAAEFWEDLILQIAREMHLGDFKPQTQAEVEDKMALWIQARGYTGGRDTQIKERARKVFKLFKD